MKHLSIVILCAFILVSFSFQIKNINHELPLETSQDYTQYIKTLKGLSTEQDLSSNPVLSSIVQDERISLLNSVEEIVLILVDQIKDNSGSLPSVDDIKNIQGLEDLFEGFDIMSLVDFDEESIDKKIKELQDAGKVIHTMEISEQLSKQLEAHKQRKLFEAESESDLNNGEEDSDNVFEQSENTIHKQQPAKVTITNQETSPSYILKFFFSLLFIIICLGSLAAIANMDNKKDTLLYAKFIADVGTR